VPVGSGIRGIGKGDWNGEGNWNGKGNGNGNKADERRELSAAREMWMPLEWSRLDGLPTTIG